MGSVLTLVSASAKPNIQLSSDPPRPSLEEHPIPHGACEPEIVRQGRSVKTSRSSSNRQPFLSIFSGVGRFSPLSLRKPLTSRPLRDQQPIAAFVYNASPAAPSTSSQSIAASTHSARVTSASRPRPTPSASAKLGQALASTRYLSRKPSPIATGPRATQTVARTSAAPCRLTRRRSSSIVTSARSPPASRASSAES